MSGVDEMVRTDPSGDFVFIVIGLSRAFQGACTGIFFVIVQVSKYRLKNMLALEVLPGNRAGPEAINSTPASSLLAPPSSYELKFDFSVLSQYKHLLKMSRKIWQLPKFSSSIVLIFTSLKPDLQPGFLEPAKNQGRMGGGESEGGEEGRRGGGEEGWREGGKEGRRG